MKIKTMDIHFKWWFHGKWKWGITKATIAAWPTGATRYIRFDFGPCEIVVKYKLFGTNYWGNQ